MTEPSTLARFFGAALIAVGALITLLSGSCTGWFLLVNIAKLFTAHQHVDPFMIIISVVVGAPFIAIGVTLVVRGRSLSRGDRR